LALQLEIVENADSIPTTDTRARVCNSLPLHL